LIAAEDEGIVEAADGLERQGAAVTTVRADLATFDGVEELHEAVQAGRTPDVLAINAGVGVSGEFADNDLASELRLVNLNITSAVHLTRLVLRWSRLRMRARKRANGDEGTDLERRRDVRVDEVPDPEIGPRRPT
jgi:short-subunit dehydrogenase